MQLDLTKCFILNIVKYTETQGVYLEFSDSLDHSWQTQGPQAESGPPPCFIQPDTLFLPGGSAELSLNC